MKLDRARFVAEELIHSLSSRCERIAVAGSICRGRSEIKDVDLVVIPKMAPAQMQIGLFAGTDFPGEPAIMVSDLENVDWLKFGRVVKNGERFKQIEIELENGETESPFGAINLDLFIVLPPAQWGVIKVIRTGPADFSHWLVTPKRAGGAMPSHLKQAGGSLWSGTTQILTPEESDYFKALGIAYNSPNERRAPQGFRSTERSI